MRAPCWAGEGGPPTSSGGAARHAQLTFGTQLRRLRVRAGFSQETLAERAGVSVATIGALEEDRRRQPYPHTVAALAEALGLCEDERAALQAAVPLRGQALDVATGGAAARVTRPAAAPGNVPAALTRLVGRQAERATVVDRLRGERLVTLAGAGGIGKTRLALAVAAELAGATSPDGGVSAWPDGVWWVELGSLADPRLLAQTVAVALGLREPPGTDAAAHLADYLHGRRLLLVLDNCDYLLEACAALTAALLRACSGLSVLATSRQPLGVVGEVVFRVPSLAVPPPPPPSARDGAPSRPSDRFEADVGTLLRVESVQFFVERARAAVLDFELTATNAAAVAELCRRLDGIPLALELAAARVRSLAVTQIAARLDDRLALLTGGGRAVLPRQQTLRASIDWSHDLLTPQERALFRRLAVFAGGFDLEAAEAVAADASSQPLSHRPGPADQPWHSTIPVDEGSGSIGADAVLDLLDRLVDKSLVLAELREGAMRYRLLETVRQYAAERLTGAGEVAA
ncbi:MAG TPA: helix-turn-helix domain-containing protein, partial [Chloroflexota bacterium]|nr:helix-turn-helix domain-containing protein [Chloroflexota bacterium]